MRILDLSSVWCSSYLFDLRWKLHSLFAGLCMVLRALAVYRHFDTPGYCAEIVSLAKVQNDVIKKALQRIRTNVSADVTNPDEVAAVVAATEEDITKINSYVQRSSQGKIGRE